MPGERHLRYHRFGTFIGLVLSKAYLQKCDDGRECASDGPGTLRYRLRLLDYDDNLLGVDTNKSVFP